MECLKTNVSFGWIFATWQEKGKEAAKDTKDLFGKNGPKLPHYEKKILKSPHLDIKVREVGNTN